MSKRGPYKNYLDRYPTKAIPPSTIYSQKNAAKQRESHLEVNKFCVSNTYVCYIHILNIYIILHTHILKMTYFVNFLSTAKCRR